MQAPFPDPAPFAHHGGRIDAAAAAWPDAPRPWIDLSTGINPHPWPAMPPAYPHGRSATVAGTRLNLADAPAIDWRALPSPSALAALEAAAATMFGAPADRVVALPGSEIGLRLLDTLGLPAPHRHVVPCYGTHRRFGSAVSLADIDTAAADGGTMLLANPNNPDGRFLDADTVRRIAARLDGNGGMLVVDEAFMDAMPVAGQPVARPDNAIVLRSFGKFFGLAGLRLGFCIAAPAIVERLRDRLGDWPINAAAIAIGTAACRDSGWIAATRDRLAAEAGRLDALLARHGLVANGDCPLFRLVETADAAAIAARLAAAGILVRPFSDRTDWLRLGLPGDDGAFDRLDRALADG